MPFQKGQVANPNGRPKYSITEALETELARVDPKTKLTKAKLIGRVAVGLAMKGELEAIKYINNRTEGMPKQAVDHTSKGDKIIPIFGGMSVQQHDSDEEGIQPY